MTDALANIIPVFAAAGVLLAVMRCIRADEERRWIERVCIGGPL